jgi:hypothetical protein
MKTFCYGGPQHGRIYELERLGPTLRIDYPPDRPWLEYTPNPQSGGWDLWMMRYTYTLQKISNGKEYIRVYVGTRGYDLQKIWNMARRYKLVEQ